MADPIVHAIATTQGHNSFSVHAREFFMGMSRCLPLTCSQWIRKFGAESQARVFQDRELVQRYFLGSPILSISLNVASEFNILYAAPGPRIGFTVWNPNPYPGKLSQTSVQD
jgi:hypothetical protein